MPLPFAMQLPRSRSAESNSNGLKKKIRLIRHGPAALCRRNRCESATNATTQKPPPRIATLYFWIGEFGLRPRCDSGVVAMGGARTSVLFRLRRISEKSLTLTEGPATVFGA